MVTFSEQARLAAPFTSDLERLSSSLSGLRAEQGTALWDSLLFTIDYFHGTRGQRALLVISDGEDRRSRATVEEVIRFAQYTSVTIYTIGLEAAMGRGRSGLRQLAEQTGGRSYLPRSGARLTEIFAEIESDLRSRYLLAYQSVSASREFREIEVSVEGTALDVQTSRGYFP